MQVLIWSSLPLALYAGLSERGEGGDRRGWSSPPDFSTWVNPISFRGGRSLCPPRYSLPPGISDLPTALLSIYAREQERKKCLTSRGFRKDFLNFPAKPRVVRTLSLLKIMAQSRGLLSQLRRQSSLHFGLMFVGVASQLHNDTKKDQSNRKNP